MSIPLPPAGPPPQGPPPGPQGPPPLFDLAQDLTIGQPPINEPARTEPKRPKPDEGQVRNRIERAKAYWSDRDQRMDDDQKLYKLSTDTGGVDRFVQDGGEVIIRNLPYVTVEKISQMLAAELPVISVESPSQDVTGVAEVVEEGIRYLWDYWRRKFRRSINTGLQQTLAHYLALRGWSAVRIHFDDEVTRGEIPLKLTVIDPRNVYPMPASDGLAYVVHTQLKTYAELLDEFPEEMVKIFPPESTEDDQPMSLEAYYDDWWHCVMVEGKMVIEPEEHGYGFVPWSIAISGGSPIRSTSDDSTSFIADVGPSIFHGIRKTLEQMNRVLSQLATEIARMSNPAKLYYYDPDENDEPQPLDLAPGATNYLVAPKEKAEIIRTSPTPSDVQPLLNALGEDLQRGSIPSILWGTAGENPSGFAVSMLSGAAKDACFGVMSGIEQVYEDISEMALKLLLQFQQEPIGIAVRDRTGRWVVGHQLTQEIIGQVGTQVHVQFRDVSPRDRVAFAQLAAQLAQSKLISLRTAREQFLHLENPDLENELVLEELIFQDEELVKQYLTPMALARYSPDLFQAWLARESRRMRQEQLMAATQAAVSPPGPAGPVQPPGPPPLPGPPVPGMPPQPGPPQLGPVPFDALNQAAGAARGPAGLGPVELPGTPFPILPPRR